MQDEIISLWGSKNQLCEQGSDFLASRFLDIPWAKRRGVCSKDGKIYFIYTMSGEPVRWKSREIENKKNQSFNKLSDEEKESFKMPFFSHFKSPLCSYLVITEGEFDCLALSQIGVLNCVSLPNGAQSVEKTFRTHYDFLQQFDVIYIAFDMDVEGEKAATKAQSMLSPEKFRRICFPCKDANEWIIQNQPVSIDDFVNLMANARKVEDSSITNMRDLPDDVFEEIDLGVSSGWLNVDEMLGGIRTGEVTVVSADTGSGKSTFCINLMKNLADQGYGIWINSYEMDFRTVTRKFAGLVLQEKLKYRSFTLKERHNYNEYLSKHVCFINRKNDSVNVEILKKQFEAASLVYGIKYILLDHLDYILSKEKKKNPVEGIDEVMREIHTLAMQFKVGVILVVHPTKTLDGKEVTMSDLKGSSSIKQYADNIIIVTRMSRLDSCDNLKTKIRVFKNRLQGIEGETFLYYVPKCDGYSDKF